MSQVTCSKLNSYVPDPVCLLRNGLVEFNRPLLFKSKGLPKVVDLLH